MDENGRTTWVQEGADSDAVASPEYPTTVGPDTPADQRKVLLVVTQDGLKEFLRAEQQAHLRTLTWRVFLRAVPLVGPFIDAPDFAPPPQRPFPMATPRDASRLFRFQGGEPVDGSLYVLHPLDTIRYLLPAHAEVEIARERFAAYSQILGALGAKSLSVVQASVREAGVSADMKAPLITKAAAQLGFDAKFTSRNEIERSTLREYAPMGARVPAVPHDLRPWLDDEPELLALERERLQFGLRKGSFSFTSRQSMVASSDFSASVANKKLRVGGAFERLHEVTWSFEVEFWPMPD